MSKVVLSFVFIILFSACAHHSAHSDKKAQVVFNDRQEMRLPENSQALLYFLDAHLYEMRDQRPQSIDAMRSAVDQEPQVAYLRYDLARLLAEAKKYQEAFEQIKIAIGLEAQQSSYHLLLGKLYSLRGQSKLALRSYFLAQQIDPDNTQAKQLIVREYLLKKNYSSAFATTRAWIKRHPRDRQAYFTLATLQLAISKKTELALKTFEKILEFAPNDYKALQALLKIYLKEKKYLKALKVNQSLERLNPQNKEVLLRSGALFLQMGKFDQAKQRFLILSQMDPSDDSAQYYLALCYDNLKNLKKAKEHYLKVPAESKYYEQAFLRLAGVLHRLKEYDDLKERLKNRIKRKPQALDYNLLASVYSEEEKYSLSIQVIEEALEKFGDDEKLLFNLAIAYDKLADTQKSLALMQRILELNPNNAFAMNYIGYTYADQGKNLNVAEKLLKKAVKLRPQDAYIRDSLAWLYYKKNKYNLALRLLLQAKKEMSNSVPGEATIYLHLGRVYEKLNRLKLANKNYKEAHRLLLKKNKKDRRDQEDLVFLESRGLKNISGPRKQLKSWISMSIGRAKRKEHLQGVLKVQYPDQIYFEILDDLGQPQFKFEISGQHFSAEDLTKNERSSGLADEKILKKYFKINLKPSELIAILLDRFPKEKITKKYSVFYEWEGEVLKKIVLKTKGPKLEIVIHFNK